MSERLHRDDTIVTAWAEYAAGPGWANAPIWLIVRGHDGTLREECIQPEDQGDDILLLYGVAATTHASLLAAVRRRVQRRVRLDPDMGDA